MWGSSDRLKVFERAFRPHQGTRSRNGRKRWPSALWGAWLRAPSHCLLPSGIAYDITTGNLWANEFRLVSAECWIGSVGLFSFWKNTSAYPTSYVSLMNTFGDEVLVLSSGEGGKVFHHILCRLELGLLLRDWPKKNNSMRYVPAKMLRVPSISFSTFASEKLGDALEASIAFNACSTLWHQRTFQGVNKLEVWWFGGNLCR